MRYFSGMHGRLHNPQSSCPSRSWLMTTLICGLCTFTDAALAEKALQRASSNLASVVRATWMGSEGTEWLSAGAFLPDGNILICGVTLSSNITIQGVTPSVLGSDAEPLPELRGFIRVATPPKITVALPDDDKELVGWKTDITGKPLTQAEEKEREKINEMFSLEEAPHKKKSAAQVQEDRSLASNQSVAPQTFPDSFCWQHGNIKYGDARTLLRLHWMQREATAFFAIFSPDLATLKKLVRFPRGAGSITSVAAAEDGSIYVAGAAQDNISKLPCRAATIDTQPTRGVALNAFGCRRTFLAKLSPDLTEVEWIKLHLGWSIAPRIRIMNDGSIALHGSGLRWYAPSGRFIWAQPVDKSHFVSALDVNPINGNTTRAGFSTSTPGRDTPVKSPEFSAFNKDGECLINLYSWGGAIQSLDYLRLMADSSIRRTAFDADGNILLAGWAAHSGQRRLRHPADIETQVPDRLRTKAEQNISADHVDSTADYNKRPRPYGPGNSSVQQLAVTDRRITRPMGRSVTPGLTNSLSGPGPTAAASPY